MQVVPPTESKVKPTAPKANGKGRHRANAAAKETLHLKDKQLTAIAPAADMADKIATAAYFLAEQRGFTPGHDLEDWLVAEQQVHSLHS